MKYNYSQDIDELNAFVDDLPQSLKVEVSLFIHEQTYKRVYFLKNRTDSFIAWICPILKPYLNLENEFIYFEGDDVTQIYFLLNGECGFVLPKHKNVKYINFNQGIHFGIVDIIGSVLNEPNQDIENWISHKDKLHRQFTAMSQTRCEILTLSINDLNRMKHEFQEPYEQLFDGAYLRLQRCLKIRVQAIKYCNKYAKKIDSFKGKSILEKGVRTFVSKLTQKNFQNKDTEILKPIDLFNVD
jgi:hypothetical protein